MLILEDLSAEIPDTNTYHWNLKELSDDDGKNVLMYGYNSCNNSEFHDETKDYNKIYFNNWAPCEFAQERDHHGLTPMDYDNKFNTIYSICPYTVDWMNQIQDAKKYKYTFYPFHKSLIPDRTEKKYDVIYHGGIHGKEHVQMLEVFRNYNYRYCTMTHGINNLTRNYVPIATNTDLQFQEKINLVAKTKISVCYNMVHVMPKQKSRILSRPMSRLNRAFSSVGRWNVMPQFKTRIHEAAISKTLNLVRRDEWNVIEDFYEPETEFVYFDNEDDLSSKITSILNNWDEYSDVLDKAYDKAMTYTTENFVSNIRKDIENDL